MKRGGYILLFQALSASGGLAVLLQQGSGAHGLPGVAWGEEQRTEVGSGLEGGVVGGGQSPAGVRSLSKKDR